jgi:hypothetical protein
MPFKYSINPDQNLIRQTLWGDITVIELRELVAAMLADPLYRKKMNILADLREARVRIPYEQMLEYTQYINSLSDIGRQAIVVGRQLEFGMARMYEQLTESGARRQDLRVFFSLEEAEEWMLQSCRGTEDSPSS